MEMQVNTVFKRCYSISFFVNTHTKTLKETDFSCDNQNTKEICLTSLCMCVHQLMHKYDYVLQCVIVISK